MPHLEKFGHYVLLEELSSYYFGKSYRAARITGNKPGDDIILLKINSDLSDKEEFIKNLQEEIALCMDLDDPNILKTLGIGKIHNTFYITRQYIRGQPLKNVLQMGAMKERHFSVDHALFVAGKLCKVLELTHSREVNGKKLIHGNLSTTSIILSYDGQVNLSGFGLTSILLYLPEWKERILLRKDEYLSPEQMTGRKIDHRSDIFTAGVILFEMLMGDPFFLPGRGINLKTRIDSVRIAKAGMASNRISDGIVHVLERSIVSDPDDRYQDIKEMRIDIETSLITDNFHATTTTLGNYMEKLFRDEIAEKQKQFKQERQCDLSGFLTDHPAGKEDIDGEIIEEISDEKISVRIEKVEIPAGKETVEDLSATEEKAMISEDDDSEKDGAIHPKKKDFFSKVSTPILIAGLLIILLLIVFYFILGRNSSAPKINPKSAVSLQAPGDRDIPDALRKRSQNAARSFSQRPRSPADQQASTSYKDAGISEPVDPSQNISDRETAEEASHQDSGGEALIRNGAESGPLSKDLEKQAAAAPTGTLEENSPGEQPSYPERNPKSAVADIASPSESDAGLDHDSRSGEENVPPAGNGFRIETRKMNGIERQISESSAGTADFLEKAPIHQRETLTDEETEENLYPAPHENETVEFPVELPAAVIGQPVMTKFYPPNYSSLARQLKISGTLHIDLLISRDGTVLKTEVPQTPQNKAMDKGGVVRSVIKASKKWQFKPATRDGHAIEKWHRIKFQVNTE